MEQFADWIAKASTRQPISISDNNGFDWQFINWYFHHFLGRNPFGHSSTNLGSLYKGVVRDMLSPGASKPATERRFKTSQMCPWFCN
jgi:hypothetical protein